MIGPAARPVPWAGSGIDYVKYHALGNDYLVIDPASAEVAVDPALVCALCDRRRGVGADGVLFGPRIENGEFWLTIFNADGSECERSGNGLRIFARYLVDSGHTAATTFAVHTIAGPSTVTVLDRDIVMVDLARASFDSTSMGASGPARSMLDESLVVDGEPLSFTGVDLGNPHCVFPCRDEDVTPERARWIAEVLRAEERFPRGANVQLACVLGPADIRIEIVERGAGRTPASGSSASAAVAACRERGLVTDQVTVHMPGGRVQVSVAPDRLVTLRGAVSPVAVGRWPGSAGTSGARWGRARGEDTADPAGYPLHRWMFDDAAGRYDIDLGGSNAEPRTVADLGRLPELSLGYGRDRGGESLRRLIAGLYGRGPDEVGVAHGAQEALYLLYRTLIRPGDHVVVIGPGWPQARHVPRVAGAAVDIVPDAPDGRPDVARACGLIGPRTRLVVLTSPANPFGRRADERAVDDLVPELRRRGAFLLADEEYLADLAGSSLLHRYELSVSVSGLSKLYGLPGLRTGWICGPRSVVDEAMTYKHWVTVANSVLTEQLAVAALRDGAARRDRYHEIVAAGTGILREWAAGRPEVEMTESDGTPFVWLGLTGQCAALDLCREFLDAGVLVMPAEVFGLRDGIRITVARRPGDLATGLDRIGRVLERRTAPLSSLPTAP